jgi:hypothetical protein
MKLLNRLLKTKKPDENTIGSMWLCAANFAIHNWTEPNWHGVMVKEVGIEQACILRDGMFVESTERNPFNFGDPARLRGYVGRMTWNDGRQSYFVGFFETKEEAEDAYRKLAKKLIDDIMSKIPKC